MQLSSSNIPKSRSPTPKSIKIEPQSPANQTSTPPSSSSPATSAATAIVVKEEDIKEEPGTAAKSHGEKKKYPFKKGTHVLCIRELHFYESFHRALVFSH